VEDLLTIIIALAVGLYSILAGRKKPPTTSSPQPSPVEYESYDTDQEYLEEAPSPKANQPVTSEPSMMDVLGKILTGDMSDFESKPKPFPSQQETEYVDPLAAPRLRQSQQAHQRKLRIAEEERLEDIANLPQGTPLRDNLRDPYALKRAIILKEVLDRPKSLRRSTRIR
jgi:hypothetical protein